VQATDRLMASLFSKKGATYAALKLSTKLAAAKSAQALEDSLLLVESMEGTLPTDQLGKADAVALQVAADLFSAASEELQSGRLTAAMKSAKGLASIFKDLGIQAGQAIAKSMHANACLLAGEPKDAVRATNEALAIFRELNSKQGEVNSLHVLVSASMMKRDIDGALVAAKEIVAIEKEGGDKQKHSSAVSSVAKLHLANDEPRLASLAVQEALGLSKGMGGAVGQMGAMFVEYESNLAEGKSSSALSAAKELVAMSKDKGVPKRLQASAQLLLAEAVASSKESLDAATDAVALFKDLGDKASQGAALLALARARYAQENKALDAGLSSAQEAAALFKEAGSKGGEALAATVIAEGYALKASTEEAERAAREALSLFRDEADAIGETFALALLRGCKTVGVAPSTARLLIDNSGVAHIEISEKASPESLEAVISTLHSRSASASCIVLHLEGCPGPEGVPSWAVASGTFIVGLRTIGLPIICAMWGRIAGPTWGLVIASDYRISTTTATFLLPPWGPPETLGDLIGHQNAVNLCMQQGPANALTLMEAGIVHQCQKGKDDTRKVASEMAKRVASCPSFPVRQTMNLMTPSMGRYAMAAAKGEVKA